MGHSTHTLTQRNLGMGITVQVDACGDDAAKKMAALMPLDLNSQMLVRRKLNQRRSVHTHTCYLKPIPLKARGYL